MIISTCNLGETGVSSINSSGTNSERFTTGFIRQHAQHQQCPLFEIMQ